MGGISRKPNDKGKRQTGHRKHDKKAGCKYECGIRKGKRAAGKTAAAIWLLPPRKPGRSQDGTASVCGFVMPL
jgi:hypothetical protein